MYTEASNFVEGVDFAYKFIFGISIFFLVAITATMLFFVFRYNKKRHPVPKQIKNNTALEITWITIPMILVLLMFYYGYAAFLPMRHAPKDAIIIKTTGQMWAWDFEYANGKHSPELIVPMGKAVKLVMHSKDVIHGMYIPQFRLKEDVIPGRETMLWFIANHEGEYQIFCSSYCGLNHSGMLSKVVVKTPDAFTLWLDEKEKVPISADAGLKLIQQNSCIACHSLTGDKLIGPSLKGIFNKKHTVITDGKEREVIADSSYIRTSIYEPDKDIVKGFNKGLMQSYKAVLTEDDVKSIIAYLETLK